MIFRAVRNVRRRGYTGQITLLSLLNSDGPVDDALSSEQLRLTGEKALAEWFSGLFPIPD